MLVDEALKDSNRRMNYAWVQNTLASFSISLARQSSLTSRSHSCLAGRNAFMQTGIAFRALVHFVQGLRHVANLGRNELQGWALPTMLRDHPHCAITGFRRELV